MADNKVGNNFSNINGALKGSQVGETSNIFVNGAIGSFFDTLSASTQNNPLFSWSNNVLDEINNISARTEEYKTILKSVNGNELNIIG